MMDGIYTAVVDRIVDGKTAVILAEDDGEVIEQFDIAVEELPNEVDEGSVLELTIAGDEIVAIEYLEDETESRKQTAQDRFDRLSERLSDN